MISNYKSKLIGKGSYGCVISPAFNCENNKIIDKTVAKLFSNKDHYDDELEKYRIVEGIDKLNKFTIKMVSNCDIDPILIEKEVDKIYKCEKIKDKFKIYQIIYEYGGIDLRELFRHYNVTNIIKILIGFIEILKGIKLLLKENYIHCDIKLDNILFDGEKLSLIDFGLLEKTSNIFQFRNLLTFKNNNIYYYPNEEKLIALYKLEKSKLKSDGLILNSIVFLKIVKEFLNLNEYRFKQYPSYLNEILALNEFIKIKTKVVLNKFKNNEIDESDFETIARKIDIYHLGITIYQVILFIIGSNSLEVEQIPLDIFKIIGKMLDPDPITRIDIDNAIEEYSKLFIKKSYNSLRK